MGLSGETLMSARQLGSKMEEARCLLLELTSDRQGEGDIVKEIASARRCRLKRCDGQQYNRERIHGSR